MEILSNHKKLFGIAFGLFLFLTFMVALLPAINNQKQNAPLPSTILLTEDALAGKLLYIDNGCVACHTQQVRNVDMDKVWGKRPGIPADYAANGRTDLWRNTATLMGTERTGPDLTDIGNRQPSAAWNLLHLYQPRAVVAQSIMPAYPWLFETKDSVGLYDTEIVIPKKYAPTGNVKVVAKKEALQLVAYLQSLKQAKLPDGSEPRTFLYEKEETHSSKVEGEKLQLDGQMLYTQNCSACHQENGGGLAGAFPPLKESPVVLGDDLELFVTIIMKGYDARPEYAVMNAVGINNGLSPDEVTAIINHEKTSWGNNAEKVSVEDVKKIMDFLKLVSD